VHRRGPRDRQTNLGRWPRNIHGQLARWRGGWATNEFISFTEACRLARSYWWWSDDSYSPK